MDKHVWLIRSVIAITQVRISLIHFIKHSIEMHSFNYEGLAASSSKDAPVPTKVASESAADHVKIGFDKAFAKKAAADAKNAAKTAPKKSAAKPKPKPTAKPTKKNKKAKASSDESESGSSSGSGSSSSGTGSSKS